MASDNSPSYTWQSLVERVRAAAHLEDSSGAARITAANRVLDNVHYWEVAAKLNWCMVYDHIITLDDVIHTLLQANDTSNIRQAFVCLKVAMRTMYPDWEISTNAMLQLIACGREIWHQHELQSESELKKKIQSVNLAEVLHV